MGRLPSEEVQRPDGSAKMEPRNRRTPRTTRKGRKGRRSRTYVAKQVLPSEKREADEILSWFADLRPTTRDDCAERERPCPWVSCKHHLYLDVDPRTGSIKLNFPDLEVWEMAETCALDIADRGGATLEQIGEVFNVTRERIRQIETIAIDKVRPKFEDLGFSPYDFGLLVNTRRNPKRRGKKKTSPVNGTPREKTMKPLVKTPQQGPDGCPTSADVEALRDALISDVACQLGNFIVNRTSEPSELIDALYSVYVGNEKPPVNRPNGYDAAAECLDAIREYADPIMNELLVFLEK